MDPSPGSEEGLEGGGGGSAPAGADALSSEGQGLLLQGDAAQAHAWRLAAAEVRACVGEVRHECGDRPRDTRSTLKDPAASAP